MNKIGDTVYPRERPWIMIGNMEVDEMTEYYYNHLDY